MRQDVAGGQLQYSQYAADGRLVWQRDETTNQRIANAYLAGSLLAVISRPLTGNTTTIRYLHTDALGSPIAKTSASGAIIEISEYEPYGRLLNRANDNRAGYTGHVMDAVSGLTYMQQRYYDPAIGRFLSVDPVTANSNPVGAFNRYWYANNNLYRFTDPDGRKCTTTDGKDSCTFDEFRDKEERRVTRDEALGGKLSQVFGRGRRILSAERAMTAKYSRARALAAQNGAVTIKGSPSLGIADRMVSGTAIVRSMETITTITYAGPSPDDTANVREDGGVPSTHDGSPSPGPMIFWNDGANVNVGTLFGHEILHTIYSGIGEPNRGWANPDYLLEHQVPFNDAANSF